MQSSLEELLNLCRKKKRKAKSCCENPANCLVTQLIGIDPGLDIGALTTLISALGRGTSNPESQSESAYQACKALSATSGFAATINTGGGAYCFRQAENCIHFCSLEPSIEEGRRLSL